mgnify:CR=1 FL=1
MLSGDILNSLRSQIVVCQKCPLHLGRKKAVPGEGPADAKVMFIGEGPGYHENEQGKPFVGQAGAFLDELLAVAGLERSNVFITNVVKCRPPANRDPEPGELAACRTYLDKQIDTINPQVIVTLGRFSMSRFLENVRISQIHGHAHLIEGYTVVTMYHPAAALHQPALRQACLQDFSHLKEIITGFKPEKKTPTPSSTPKGISEESHIEQLSLF